MALRGRAEELAILSERVRQAARGRGGLVTVEGPAGTGKTRLLAEVAALARSAGFTVAACTAAQRESAPVAEVLAPLVAGDLPVLRRDDLDRLRTRPDQRLWVLARARAGLDERVRRGPVLISLDAAQWADPLTLLAVRMLALRRSADLWIVARRPLPLSSEVAGTLAQLAEASQAQLRLGALSRDEARLLAEDVLQARPDPAVLDLVDRAAGNPHYVVELLASLLEDGGVLVEEGSARLVRRSLPARLRSAVSGHLAAVSDEARGLLAAGAVFGRTFELRDAAALLRCSGGRLLPAVRELLLTELLVEERSRLAFRHPLVHQVVYDSTPAPRRRRLHRRAAAVLDRAGRPRADAALQLAAAAHTGDGRAIAAMRRAARQLEARSPGVAADLWVRILELLPAGHRGRGRVGERASAMLVLSGRLREAERLVTELLQARPAAQLEPALRLRLAHALVLGGGHEAAREQAANGLRRDGLTDPIRAQLLAVAAVARAPIEEPAGALVAARAALAAAADTGKDGAVVVGLCAISEVELRRGRLRNAWTAATRAVGHADSGRLGARRWHPRLWTARSALALDRLDDAERALLAVRQESEDYGTAWALPHQRALQAAVLAARGRLEAAAAEAEAAVGIAREAGARGVAAQALGLLARTRLHLGVPRSPGQARRRAGDLASELDASDPGLTWALALLADADGDPVDALRMLGGDGGPLPLELLAIDPAAAPLAVRIAIRAGDEDRAAAVVREIERLARLNEHVPSIAGCAMHATGLLRPDVDRLRRAVHLLRGSPRPLALAFVLEDLGRAMIATGERAAAVPVLEETLTIFRAVGASADATLVQRSLRGIGVRTPQRSIRQGLGRGWDTLTSTERAVAGLVAEGLTNRGIAERMFVSSSTVNTHLRHIFTKLGISSRVHLTLLAAAPSTE